MNVESGDIKHVHVPAQEPPYSNGARFDLIEGPGGEQHLMPNRTGRFTVVSCNAFERDGIALLNVGLRQIY
jgi:hypothetical protein